MPITQEQFQVQLGRLAEQFRGAYGSERMRMIWREAKVLEYGHLVEIIDRFVGESRQAPLVPEFRDAIAIIREREWQKQKGVHKREAKEFSENFGPTEIKFIVEGITKRLQRRTSDADWGQFQKLISETARAASNEPVYSSCETCDGTGLVLENNYAFKCTCEAGRKRRECFPTWRGNGFTAR